MTGSLPAFEWGFGGAMSCCHFPQILLILNSDDLGLEFECCNETCIKENIRFAYCFPSDNKVNLGF